MENCRREGEVELSEFGRQELEEALTEVKEGKIKKFDSLNDLIKDLNDGSYILLTCGTHDKLFK